MTSAPLENWMPPGGFDTSEAYFEDAEPPDYSAGHVALNGDGPEPEPGRSVPSVRHSWQPVDLVELGKTPPRPPTVLGLLYPGRTHIIFGQQGSMKTMLALAAAVEVIKAGGTVFYVDHHENDPADLLERLTQLGLTHEQIRRGLVFIRPEEPATDPLVMGDLRALIAERRPELIIIDSLIGSLALHNVEPNSGVEIERWRFAVVEPLREHGAIILALDHVTQNQDTRDRPIGSERKLSAFEVGFQAERIRQLARGVNGNIKLRNRKDRGAWHATGVAAEVEFTSDAETHLLGYSVKLGERTDQSEDFRPTNLMAKVSRYVHNCAEPPSRNQVETDVAGKNEWKRVAIDTLIRESYLSETIGPRKAKLLTSEKLYQEAMG